VGHHEIDGAGAKMTAGGPAVFARPKPLTALPKTSILRRKVS
jgi:hypothetical protein